MFTVMSYFGSSNTGGSLPGFSSGPQLLDIAAAQLLYGPNMTTRTGDTVYGFHSNTGEQHFTISAGSQGAVFAIWDAGGNDTLDLSGYSTDSEIDLRPESFSSAGPGDPNNGPGNTAIGNISIARGVVIENATGGSGNDTLIGNDVANTLDGGAGADHLSGGLGDDTYVVDNVGDVVSESANAGIDTVQSSLAFGLGANVENLILTGAAAVNGFGNSLDNVITGNDAVNWLYGYDGADTLDGGAGADKMFGGTGNDTYIVDNNLDFIVENPGEGVDTVQSSLTRQLGANFENLVLTGTDAINGLGNGLDNVITGNSAGNWLYGYDGNDTLDGGAGTDHLNGGAGNDVFVLRAGEANGDTIMDFDGQAAAAGDSLQLLGYGTAAQGASFIQIDATHWQINSADGTIHDIITVANAASFDPSDYIFGP